VLTRSPLRTSLLAAAACALPVLALPFMLDDWFQLAAVRAWRGFGVVHPYFEGWEDPWGTLNCFAFFRGPDGNLPQLHNGLAPWWLDPDLEIRFLRPLASTSALLDSVLFGERAWLYHAHSLLWYGVLVVVVGRLYRRYLSPPVAALALLCFAVDDAHWFPVAWIANRNALMSTALGLSGLLAHQAWQADGRRSGLPLSLLLLALGLAAGETALGVFGLLATWQIVAAPGSPGRRLVGLMPALLLGLGWALLYKGFGYGAHGSGLYLDPVSDPLAFAVAGLERAPMLLSGQLLGLPVDAWFFAPVLRFGMVAIGAAAVLLSAWLLVRAWPSLDPADRHALRWLIPGGLLALVPVLATFPLARLLLVPGVGLTVLVAALMHAAWTGGRRGLALALAAPHLLLAPVSWWGQTAGALYVEHRYEQLAQSPVLHDPRPVLAPVLSDPSLAIYLPVAQGVQGVEGPARWHLLSMTPGDRRLTRTGPASLRIDLVGEALPQAPYEALFRDFHARPIAVGEVHRAEGLIIEVLTVQEGRPRSLSVQVDGDLDAWQLVAWQEGTLRRVAPPAVGENVLLPWSRGPMGI